MAQLQAPVSTINEHNLTSLCDWVAAKDPALKAIIKQYGYPPMFSRPATFASLVHIILEQQVSLAAAKAAMNRLRQTIGEVTPTALLQLTDAELKACYFSRQKIIYVRHLAESILNNILHLENLAIKNDEAVRTALKQIKGIGDWTSDVFLLMCLQRTDIFPIGDLALVKSMLEVKQLPDTTTRQQLVDIASAWQPYRSIAAFMLWHAYIQKRKIIL